MSRSEAGQDIVAWYALIDSVYQLLEAPQPLDLRDPGVWEPVLRAAALQIGCADLRLESRCSPSAEFGRRQLSADGKPSPHPPQVILRTDPAPCLFELRLVPSAADPAPNPAQRAQLQALLTHIERCLQLWEQALDFRRKLDAMYAVLQRQTTPVVLFDIHCRPLFCNHAARSLAQRLPALRLTDAPVQYCEADRERLQPLFARWRRTLQRGAQKPQRLITEGLIFSLLPLVHERLLPPRFVEGGPCLALLIERRAGAGVLEDASAGLAPPPVPRPLARHLRQCFNLTDREQALAYALYTGLSLQRYAQLAGRSTLTLRKQLQSIFAKLGVHDQKEVVLALWSAQQAVWLEHTAIVSAARHTVGAHVEILYPPSLT